MPSAGGRFQPFIISSQQKRGESIRMFYFSIYLQIDALFIG